MARYTLANSFSKHAEILFEITNGTFDLCNKKRYDFAHIVLAMNPVCRTLIVAKSSKIQNAVNPVWRRAYRESLNKKR